MKARVGTPMGDEARFRWVPQWGREAADGKSGAMAHHGIAVAADGRVVTFDPGHSSVRIFRPDGRLLESWEAPVATGHGLRIAGDGAAETLWIADNGDSWVRLADGSYGSSLPVGTRVVGAVVQMSLTGVELARLPTPDHPAYETGSYCPTDVAVDCVESGGRGDIWVADGYGQSLVHHFSANGRLLGTITGDEGLGRFRGPHAVYVDRRRGVPEVYVADRANSRIQVFNVDGKFLRAVGVGTLISPGGFARLGDELIVAELDGRLAILGRDDDVVAIIGRGSLAGRDAPGWPNALDSSGATVRPQLKEGVFNTPHGIASDQSGNIYISEWVIGGRLIKLEPWDKQR